MLPWKAVDMHLQLDRSHCWVEVEEAFLFDLQPVRQVLGVGQCGGETHDSHRVLLVGSYEVCSGDNYFQHRSPVIA